MSRPIAVPLALAALLAACGAEQAAQPIEGASAGAASEAGLEVIPVTIESGGTLHRFSAEVARTEEEQARGLMFRDSLAPDAGMLFPFDPPRPASFWMKDTLIPLDMIFIRPDGTIARIAVNTVPHSLQPEGVEEPTAAVLELAGGRTVELGISEGDRVSWPGGPAAPSR